MQNMHKSIVTKYFWLCSVVILSCVICIGSVLLLVASQFYKTEKKEALLAGVNEIITATKLCYLQKQALGPAYLNSVYRDYAASSGINFSLFNNEGFEIVSTSSSDGCKPKLDSVTLNSIDETGLFEIGHLGGYFNKDFFVLAMPLEIDGQDFYVAGYRSADSFKAFMGGLVGTFAIVSVFVLIVVFTAVYYVIKRLLRPIKEMTDAAQRFGRGDFSQRIEIYDDNEIGILACTLNEMAYSLSMLENSRKSFVANVSHELKTPMTTIGGFIDGILDGTIPPEKHRQYLKIVSEEVSRLSRLVRSMLNISKYETGEVKLKITSFDVTSLAVKTLLLFEGQIEKKKIEIVGLDSPPLYMEGDVDLIQQVVYNLVENAVKFVNEGGYIAFKFEYQNENAVFSIKNSGEGLTQDELPKVFDRFYKTDESHGKDKTGVGLGLAIVRSIINLHGGNILVRSTKGEYTEFSFSLKAGEPLA